MRSNKTEDILVICLLLLSGDTSKSIEEAISQVEEYQLDNDRHFGIGREDFRNLFYWLGLETGRLSFNDISTDKVETVLRRIPIKDWIGLILGFDEVYFNDEGEGWLKYEEREISGRKQLISDFFAGKNKYEPGEVLAFLHQNGFTDELLEGCSRPGESS